jgi:hypothetical protein
MIANTPPPAGETYWRNRVGDEIALQREKVKTHYQRNNDGMTDEQFVRLNIFSLCESIARTKWSDQT